MEIIIGAAFVVVVLLMLMNLRARSIAKRHAVTLSSRTGIPADQIRSEMINGNETPGEWAVRHGLDRWTFFPAEDRTERIIATIDQKYPSEKILAVSEGQFDLRGGPIAVAATDRAMHSETPTEHIRNEYSSINKVVLESGAGRRGLLLAINFDGNVALPAYLVDAVSVASAIEEQLAKITLYTERVELTPEGGAVFRWRQIGDEYAWWIVYDPSIIGPDGRPTAEADAAQSEAIKRLNQRIPGGPETHEGRP